MIDTRKPQGKMRRPELPYVLPTVTLIGLLFVVPIVFVLLISFTNFKLGMSLDKVSFYGIQNYARLFNGTESAFGHSIGLSFWLMVLGTGLQLVLGMICALLLNHEFRGKAIAIACLIIPIAVTPSIIAQVWKLMFNSEFGVINYLLKLLFNTTVSWLDMDHAFLAVLIATVWQYTPFVTLMLYAGMRSLPDSPYESAMIEGANKWQQFIYLTLPMMKKLILLCVLLRSIDMLKTFDIPYVLTQGGPGSATKFLGLLIYDIGFGETNFIARSAAVAVIMILLVSILSVFLFRLLSRSREA